MWPVYISHILRTTCAEEQTRRLKQPPLQHVNSLKNVQNYCSKRIVRKKSASL